jgi:hypothetical protein
MADPDKENKVGDVYSPENRPVHSRDTESVPDLITPAEEAPGNNAEEKCHTDIIPGAGFYDGID